MPVFYWGVMHVSIGNCPGQRCRVGAMNRAGGPADGSSGSLRKWQPTLSEKKCSCRQWEREFRTTLRVLQGVSPDRTQSKAHGRSLSAGELAWTFAVLESAVDSVVQGQI